MVVSLTSCMVVWWNTSITHRLYGCMVVSLTGCMVAWLYGCMVVSLTGCMVVWWNTSITHPLTGCMVVWWNTSITHHSCLVRFLHVSIVVEHLHHRPVTVHLLPVNGEETVTHIQYKTERLDIQYKTERLDIQYSTVQYSTVQYSTVQYSTVQYSTVQYSTVQSTSHLFPLLYQTSSLPSGNLFSLVPFSLLVTTATPCSVVAVVIPADTRLIWWTGSVMQYSTGQCNAVQYRAV